MTAVEHYATRIAAVQAQQRRLLGDPPTQRDRWGGQTAQRFREEPHRKLSPNLAIIASYVQPEDVVIDVGGGAGRVGLPLALHCRELINVDPSPGMLAEFQASVAEAGISNARSVQADWLAADGIQGDLAIVSNVTYFVRDIRTFIEKLEATSRRRVLITVWSVPPPNRHADLTRLLFGEEEEEVPGHKELLPVLWEMGILPDVRVLPETFTGNDELPQTREALASGLLQRIVPPWFLQRRPEFETRARGLLEAHLDEWVAHTPQGYVLRRIQDARELIITWEPKRER